MTSETSETSPAPTTASDIPLSMVDFCTVYEGEDAHQSMRNSVELAQRAEKLGIKRIWYSEHHNMKTITSSSPAVLISHIGAHTSTIRLGSGGVMLPNHAPYVVAEQFGTLASLYPNRIDLGLGRAPGTDMNTLGRALRRDAHSAERFPEDIKELQGFLSNSSPIPGVQAVPGTGTNVPIYILGSSMYGASLAAKFGLPYSFASHFAPQHLEAATTYYRDNFTPSEYLDEPYVIAAVNVVGAETPAAADELWERVKRKQVKAFFGRDRYLTDEQVEQILNSFQGQQAIDMLRYSAIGDPETIRQELLEFKETAHADELMVSLQATNHQETMTSLDVLAQGWGLGTD